MHACIRILKNYKQQIWNTNVLSQIFWKCFTMDIEQMFKIPTVWKVGSLIFRAYIRLSVRLSNYECRTWSILNLWNQFLAPKFDFGLGIYHIYRGPKTNRHTVDVLSQSVGILSTYCRRTVDVLSRTQQRTYLKFVHGLQHSSKEANALRGHLSMSM